MAMPAAFVTPEEYLQLERESEEKHEYINGAIHAMSGASLPHVFINADLMIAIGNKLKGQRCQPLGSDMRVRVPSRNLYCYPDLTIVCGDPILEEDVKDTLLNPTVIIEILSPSTERWDRGGKFRRLGDIETLREYVLVSQSEPVVERFERSGDQWILTTSEGLEASLTLSSVGISVSLAEIYARVTFDPNASER